ncbi:iron-containing alcohol dehydrogenase family protein [Ruminococcus sp.]|uniref:iron-containing alcohol dehydrogenase family protein n=1 Tax=Ruminococcus sp. TaxID=41978 RepID=UPI002CD8E125|nr:iron-containing alcohol dehydrogenase family protein [Ruminococcus sp.]HNZ99872.1 iron-containing alcohol dehydrogenase family protein [Ruminococcus sp.]HOH87143.1 iron-containing alcohol dehydrogenase family protein [Ruminococcus sp.]
MNYYMPVKVLSESNCVLVHSADLAALGSCALIVTGRGSSKKNGSLDDVKAALEAESIRYTVFDEVEENPSVETVMKARDMGVSCGADFVVGVGGGSPLDAAKAIAVMIKNAEASWQLLFDGSASPAHIPVAAVPTTCGTGSEVTAIAVLTRHDLRTKTSMVHKVFPDIALCDGKYLLGAPLSVIANTAVDALGHMIESYINSAATPFSRMFADTGLKLWSSCREYISGGEKLTEKAAADLLGASTLGGMAIAHTSTSLPHGLSYTLTYEGGIPHGAAVGLFQSGYLRLADVADRSHILSLTGFDSTDSLAQFIAEVSPVTADRSLLERAAENLLKNTRKLASCPYKADRETLYDIIGGVICSG